MEITTFVLGEMPEWSNGPDSKSGVLLAVPGVRIPFSPLNKKSKRSKTLQIIEFAGFCIFIKFNKKHHFPIFKPQIRCVIFYRPILTHRMENENK